MSSRFMLAVMMALAMSSAAYAQAPAASCTPSTFPVAQLPKEIDLYAKPGQFEDYLETAKLGKSVTLLDCGDPVYLRLDVNGEPKLVKRSNVKVKIQVEAPCICGNGDARTTTLGAPGAGEVNYCPASKCPAAR